MQKYQKYNNFIDFDQFIMIQQMHSKESFRLTEHQAIASLLEIDFKHQENNLWQQQRNNQSHHHLIPSIHRSTKYRYQSNPKSNNLILNAPPSLLKNFNQQQSEVIHNKYQQALTKQIIKQGKENDFWNSKIKWMNDNLNDGKLNEEMNKKNLSNEMHISMSITNFYKPSNSSQNFKNRQIFNRPKLLSNSKKQTSIQNRSDGFNYQSHNEIINNNAKRVTSKRYQLISNNKDQFQPPFQSFMKQTFKKIYLKDKKEQNSNEKTQKKILQISKNTTIRQILNNFNKYKKASFTPTIPKQNNEVNNFIQKTSKNIFDEGLRKSCKGDNCADKQLQKSKLGHVIDLNMMAQKIYRNRYINMDIVYDDDIKKFKAKGSNSITDD